MPEYQASLDTGNPQSDSLMGVLSQQSTLTSFVKQAGLQEVANMVEGDNFVVCDLELHGVQGCADMREMVANQQMMAECVAIGLAIFAVAFVNLVTTFAAPLGMNRIYAIVLHRLNEILREKAT